MIFESWTFLELVHIHVLVWATCSKCRVLLDGRSIKGGVLRIWAALLLKERALVGLGGNVIGGSVHDWGGWLVLWAKQERETPEDNWCRREREEIPCVCVLRPASALMVLVDAVVFPPPFICTM